MHNLLSEMKPARAEAVFSSISDRILFAVTVSKLIERGYSKKFRRETYCLFCIDDQECFGPTDFSVLEVYELGANARPEVERVVYAIYTNSGVKGLLVDSYGAYTDNISMELFRKLRLGSPMPRPAIKAMTKKMQY